MNRLLVKASTALRLGIPNLARVASYRLGVRLGINPVRNQRAVAPEGPFFVQPIARSMVTAPVVEGWQETCELFSHWRLPLAGAVPDWLANPMTGQRVQEPGRPWWQIPDFDLAVGDVKVIWELSRFDWVLAFAQRAARGDSAALDRLNLWLADWCCNNPPYLGPNWKCGQEASIRVMHLGMASLLLGQRRASTAGLQQLVQAHMQRIAPTLKYAVAQDNNHGTSEAAALFIGGSWLADSGCGDGTRWMQQGRKWLENRAARLIGEQGSFSQYSLNYHRLMLDTFCMAEVWRRHLGLPVFSARWRTRALVAAQWLRHMINPANGDGPNLGSNDGARLLQLTNTLYRDYRPTVQLAMALFGNERAYAEGGPWDHGLQWLRVPLPERTADAVRSYVADDGGFAMLHKGQSMAMLRYPRFKFRPSQADALHVDLWVAGQNLLRDAGTYSYNTDPRWLNYFGGTAGHNTVQFDGRDQMPRLSRFLFGDWLRTSMLEPLRESNGESSFGAGYRDRQGASHQRWVTLCASSLTVVDQVGGFRDKAVLRWRLAPGDWQVDGDCVRNGEQVLRVQADVALTRFELTSGWESRHYLEKTEIPVLEVQVNRPGTLTTEYGWAS